MILFGSSKEIQHFSFQLRQEVFVKEQGIPEHLEFDERTNKTYCYFVYLNHNCPIGTIRLEVKNSILYPDRLCVLKNYRYQGIGKKLLTLTEEKGRELGLEKAFLYGEEIAAHFYLKNGWITNEKTILIDGIPCFLFEKNLNESET